MIIKLSTNDNFHGDRIQPVLIFFGKVYFKLFKKRQTLKEPCPSNVIFIYLLLYTGSALIWKIFSKSLKADLR